MSWKARRSSETLSLGGFFVSLLQRSQESEQRLALRVGQRSESLSDCVRFVPVAQNRRLDGRRAAIVQQWPAEAQSPQRRRPDLIGRGRRLRNVVARRDVV